MTTLYMDVEAMRDAKSAFMDLQNVLFQMVGEADSIVAMIETFWEAPSEVDFYNQYLEIKSDLLGKLDSVAELTSLLSNEIQEWEDAASKLNAGSPSSGTH